MNINLVNHGLRIGEVKVISVAGSSVVLIGDAEAVTCSSTFESQPESFVAPLPEPWTKAGHAK